MRMLIDTGMIHISKRTKRPVCKIYRLPEKLSKYPPEKLVEIRKQKGIGRPLKIGDNIPGVTKAST